MSKRCGKRSLCEEGRRLQEECEKASRGHAAWGSSEHEAARAAAREHFAECVVARVAPRSETSPAGDMAALVAFASGATS